MTLLQIAELGGLGAAAGIVGAVFGIGGGVFVVPALTLGFGLPMSSAVAASLVAVAASSSAAGAVRAETGLADMRLGLSLEVATVFGTVIAASAAAFIPAAALRTIFSLALVPVSFALARKALVSSDDGETGETPAKPKNMPAALAVSAVAGGLSGLLGIGGGVLKVPMMRLVCGVPAKVAVATSNFMIGVTASAGALVYFARGALPGRESAVLALGVMAGALAGMRLLVLSKSRTLELAFSAALLAIAVKMIL